MLSLLIPGNTSISKSTELRAFSYHLVLFTYVDQKLAMKKRKAPLEVGDENQAAKKQKSKTRQVNFSKRARDQADSYRMLSRARNETTGVSTR